MSNQPKKLSSQRKSKPPFKLPSLQSIVHRDNPYKQKNTIEYVYQNIIKKNNRIKLNQLDKFHKPYSGNPLKFHNDKKDPINPLKKDLMPINNNKNGERGISTANPYIGGPTKYNSNVNNNDNIKQSKNKNLYERFSLYPDKLRSQKYRNKSNNHANNLNLNNNQLFLVKKSNEYSIPENVDMFINKNKTKAKPSKKLDSKYLLVASNNTKLNDAIVINDKGIKNDNIYEDANENTTKIAQKNSVENLCFISYYYCEFPNLEHRKEMEDFHYIKILLNEPLSCSYFAVFDGHSGKEVGIYLKDNLHKILSKELKQIDTNNDDYTEDIKQAIKTSFESIDVEINTNQNYKNDVGSTGTVLLLYRDKNSSSGKSLICANVGDSKAYLLTKKEAKIITKDHVCTDEEEVKRIKSSGGIVFRQRVFGTLMLTRSFGDKEMKKYGVLPTPDLFYRNICEDDLFVVIASDGVWDVVNEDEIFNMAQGKISSEEFSKKLIELAKERETHDNISCIVVKLNTNS